MTDQYSEQTIGNLTRSQLEEIIEASAKKTIKLEYSIVAASERLLSFLNFNLCGLQNSSNREAQKLLKSAVR